jgi:SMC interacting uncharacterized protein involved in chromosome segregation
MVKIPEINVDALNRELGGIAERANISGLQEKAQEAISQFEALRTTTLSTEVNKIASGFQALTEELDDIEGLYDAQKVATRGVALLVDNAPGLQIVNNAPGLNTDLETLTEGSVGGGQLNFKVTAPTPEALSKALSEVTGEPLEVVSRALGDISLASVSDLNAVINNVVGKGLTVGNDFLNQVTSFTSSIEDQIGNLTNGFTGQIKNIAEELNGQLGPALNKITNANIQISESLKPQIAQLLETNEIARAAEILSQNSNLGIAEIEERLSNIPVTVSEKVGRNLVLPGKGTISRVIGG